METIERKEVVEALDVAIKAVLQDAKLPRLSEREHSALVSLQTVALLLDLNDVAGRVVKLLTADREMFGSHFCDELAEAL
jgi:hypothetical protein